MATVRFALGPDPVNRGLQTILADRGDGYKPVRGGKFSDAENEAQIRKLEGRKIKVERRPA